MAGTKKPLVLVIDDEKSSLQLVCHILEKAGHQVLTAPSGYTGFVQLERSHENPDSPQFDLLIVDWKMPGWDGIRVLTEIRARKMAVPVILMSGALTREQLEIAGKNKADAVILKPILEEALLAKVSDLLAKKKPAAPAES